MSILLIKKPCPFLHESRNLCNKQIPDTLTICFNSLSIIEMKKRKQYSFIIFSFNFHSFLIVSSSVRIVRMAHFTALNIVKKNHNIIKDEIISSLNNHSLIVLRCVRKLRPYLVKGIETPLYKST